MGVTISTHNGSKVAREHNVRNRKVTDKEKHIDKNGVYEIWVDEKVRDAYKRIFGDALKTYNQKQTRDDRKIKSYYNSVCDDAKKHPVYEMIIGVYGRDENGVSICSLETGKAIMKEFVANWKERNPNLELIGAYYHADEEGEPHCHIDYIPVAHGYKRGLEVQNGLVKALGEMGIEKSGRMTAQIQWEARENQYLEELCNERGLVVDHLKENKRKHLETEQYKATEALNLTIDDTKGLLDIQDGLNAEIRELEAKRDTANKQAVKALRRKTRILRLKKDRSGRGFTYDKDLAKDIGKEVKSLRKEAEAISRTDLELKCAYEEIERQKIRIEKKKEELDERERGLNSLEWKQERYIDERVEMLYKECVKERKDKLRRLENYCRDVKLKDGRSVLDGFEEQEFKNRLNRQRNHER